METRPENPGARGIERTAAAVAIALFGWTALWAAGKAEPASPPVPDSRKAEPPAADREKTLESAVADALKTRLFPIRVDRTGRMEVRGVEVASAGLKELLAKMAAGAAFAGRDKKDLLVRLETQAGTPEEATDPIRKLIGAAGFPNIKNRMVSSLGPGATERERARELAVARVLNGSELMIWVGRSGKMEITGMEEAPADLKNLLKEIGDGLEGIHVRKRDVPIDISVEPGTAPDAVKRVEDLVKEAGFPQIHTDVSERAVDREYGIGLKSRSFVPEPGIAEAVREEFKRAGGKDARRHLFVQFYNRVAGVDQGIAEDRLAPIGAKVLDFIPQNAWFVSADRRILEADLGKLGIRWIGPIEPGDKVNPEILGIKPPDDATEPDGFGRYVVVFFEDVPTEARRAAIGKKRRVIRESSGPTDSWIVALPPGELKAFAADDAVQWIGSAPRVPHVN